MKLGLLSFHNAANYGAALQIFALQKVLLDRGFDCEYINYQNNHRRVSYSMTYHLLSSLKKGDIKSAIRFALGSPFMILRKARFRSFYRKNLKQTSRIYTSPEEARELNHKYTKFIIGSDQVWNWSNNGRDEAFLLSFVEDDAKKISYSSSFGVAEISDEQKSIYRNYLSKIKHLSVREKYGIKLVKNLTDREAILVLDPVFLLSKQQWERVADSKKKKETYIFSYTNQPSQLESFFSVTGYNVQNSFSYKLSRNITIKDFLHSKVRVKYTMSLSEFLSVIRDAYLIVSASFHCVALSIIMNKPFVAILAGNKGKDERLLTILSLLGLEERIFTDKMTEEQVNEPIDYDSVNKKIEALKASSMKFLLNAIQY
ncbi:hypothetical protein DO021_10750 [Desulfobacter hydrogenophilus]|uniref:Polysaccharide pyruvyl transferase family protein n=1 Tax=Desulfobacter hydrogenophilus TaxID=2291 RepID=A0A328FCH5_9BACT|nr:polysaccharide pyruvyl transferase family protein [Desulfobacter hydrogenophilus]NDY71992.1 polysaccharide pyruvyl transferase family protein [Desulfobacter hydrogenophilus]QBH15441.1 polysaccharide pyruvyl transferase family protein [Desulfobacter hydrogenophilus]RAM01916.1 hypothetical protein DO021_10750 [Desulfobacter hydrogenophilus]